MYIYFLSNAKIYPHLRTYIENPRRVWNGSQIRQIPKETWETCQWSLEVVNEMLSSA